MIFVYELLLLNVIGPGNALPVKRSIAPGPLILVTFLSMVLACVTRELRMFNGRATQPILILLVEICIFFKYIYICILVLVPFHMLSLTRRTLDKERVANIHPLAAKLSYALHFAYCKSRSCFVGCRLYPKELGVLIAGPARYMVMFAGKHPFITASSWV